MNHIKRGICVGSIVLKDNKVLFARQAKGHPLEGQWSIPGEWWKKMSILKMPS